MKEQFAKELSLRLVEHYGRIPSAGVLARDFNLKNRQFSPISQETARRWMRGISLPELDRLKTLIDWLGMDLAFIATPSNLQKSDLDHLQRLAQLDHHEQKIIEAYRKADVMGKRTLFAVARSIID